MCRILLIISLILTPAVNYAQTNDYPNWEVGATTGVLLPSNILGVTEVLPAWGFRLGTGVYSFRPEVLVTHARASGVLWYHGLLSVRNQIKLEGMQGMQLFYLLGINGAYWKRAARFRDFPFRQELGYHFGGGVIIDITESIKFRTDVYFAIYPGRVVYTGAGLSYTLPSSNDRNRR